MGGADSEDSEVETDKNAAGFIKSIDMIVKNFILEKQVEI